MYIRSKAQLRQMAELCAQIRAQVLPGDERGDEDWNAPVVGLDGAAHCVRVPLGGSPESKLRKARLKAEKASAGEGFGQDGAEGPPYLVSAEKSGKSRRGLKGIPAGARRLINRRAQIFGAFPGATAFLTVAFSDEQLVMLSACPDGVQVWFEAFRHRVERLLSRHSDRPLALWRWEMHPARSVREERPLPHLHGLARVKGRRWDKGYWLTPSEVKEAACEAFRAVERGVRGLGLLQGLCDDGLARGQLWVDVAQAAAAPPRVDMQLAKNPAAYLSKYVSKNADGTSGFEMAAYPEVVPHQWHGCTRELKAASDCCTTRLPGPMAQWLWANGGRLEREGLCRLAEWTPPGCSSYRVTSVYIRTAEALAQLWELFLWESGYGRWLDSGSPPLGLSPVDVAIAGLCG